MLLNPKYKFTEDQLREQHLRIKRNVEVMDRLISELSNWHRPIPGRRLATPGPTTSMAHNTARSSGSRWSSCRPWPAHLRARPPLARRRRFNAQVINPELNGGLLVGGSHVLLVWGSDGTILRSEDGAHWVHAVTPGSADLTRVAANERGDVLIAVGATGTILRSTDAGRTWQAAHNTTKDTDLRAVVNQPGSRTWVSVGTNGRILRSINNGRKWSLIESQLTVAFQTLFVDPDTKVMLIGGDEGMVGYSKNAGESWQITALTMPSRPHRSPRFIVSANYCSPPARSADF